MSDTQNPDRLELSRLLRVRVLRLRRTEQPTRDLTWWRVAFLHKNGVTVLLHRLFEAHWPGYLDDSAWVQRLPAHPPMPPDRFNHEDAEAIVAYLRSLATHDK